MNQFMRLMKKDWRLNRATVVGLLIMNIVAYGLGFVAYLRDRYTTVVSTPYRTAHAGVPFDIQIGAPLSEYLRTAAVMGAMFAVLAAAVFGGAAFAIERREGSADFLAMLPVKRRKIIASKLLVAFAVLGTALGINVGVLPLPDLLASVFIFAALGLALFGIAWLLSTFMNSAAIAASVSIATVGCGVLLFSILWRTPAKGVAPEMVIYMACGAAIVCIITGSGYYLRRVAP